MTLNTMPRRFMTASAKRSPEHVHNLWAMGDRRMQARFTANAAIRVQMHAEEQQIQQEIARQEESREFAEATMSAAPRAAGRPNLEKTDDALAEALYQRMFGNDNTQPAASIPTPTPTDEALYLRVLAATTTQKEA